MSAEQNKTVVRRFFDDFNRQDFSTQPELASPDYELDFPGGPGSAYGLAGLRQATEGFAATFPDLHFAVEALVAEGEQVAASWTMTGHQQGPLGPIAATGRAVHLTGTSL